MKQTNKHQIIWEKWTNPFEVDHSMQQANNLKKNSDSSIYEQEYEEEVEYIPQNIKGIITPMGFVPYNENTATDKIFKFWVGHTNFDISRNLANKIEKTEGVEVLDIFTRYRFRIGIGKAFKDRMVMQAIQRAIT